MHAITEINKVLDRMLGIKGIIGIIVMKPSGDILAFQKSENLSKEHGEEICGLVYGMIDSIRDLELFPNEVVYRFYDKQLIMKCFDAGFLLIVTKITTSPSMLKISVKVTVKKLLLLLEEGKNQNLSGSKSIQDSRDSNSRRESSDQINQKVLKSFCSSPDGKTKNSPKSEGQNKMIKNVDPPKKPVRRNGNSKKKARRKEGEPSSKEDGFIMFS